MSHLQEHEANYAETQAQAPTMAAAAAAAALAWSAPTGPARATPTPAFEPCLSFQLETTIPLGRGRYPAGPRPKPQAQPEKLIAIATLGPEARAAVETLISLGADELSPGVTLARVKKAYRRLARQFHPDLATQPDQGQRVFLELKAAYETLRQLKSLGRSRD